MAGKLEKRQPIFLNTYFEKITRTLDEPKNH